MRSVSAAPVVFGPKTKTVRLSSDAIHAGNLILINSTYALQEGLCGKCLVTVDEINHAVRLDLRAASVLRGLLEEIDPQGQIAMVSGFRSMREQSHIYNTSLKDNGIGFTEKYVARPGHSEHQSGLAIDLGLNRPDIDFLRPYFPYEGICDVFRRKALRFGFVERYQKEKEAITGIAHEPWHFRYVGAPHAEIMDNMNLSLEEYIEMLRDFPYGSEPFRFAHSSLNVEIFFLAADGGGGLINPAGLTGRPLYLDGSDPLVSEATVSFEIEEDLPYTISGNNVDGFIVTIWQRSQELQLRCGSHIEEHSASARGALPWQRSQELQLRCGSHIEEHSASARGALSGQWR